MFTIEEKEFGVFTEYRIRNIETGEFVSILPEFGATINQIALKKEDRIFELLSGCVDYQELITEGKSKFKGSKLFPFPNRIDRGVYTFENKKYQFPLNFSHENNAIHGIVLEHNFSITKKTLTNQSGSITLQYEMLGTDEGYPFKATITISYVLDCDGFSCKTIIENNDTKNIPIGDGWHPYFKTGSKMDDCLLKLPVDVSFDVNERMIPNGDVKSEKKFNSLTQIGITNFDTGYKVMNTSHKKTITTLQDPINKITLNIWQESGEGFYDYLQVYIPSDRMSIAVEPMSCLANAFNNGEGLIILKPGEKKAFSFGLIVE